MVDYVVAVELLWVLVSKGGGWEGREGKEGDARAFAPPLTLKTTVLLSCGEAMLCCSSWPTCD